MLVALTPTQAQFIDVADGSVKAMLDGVNGRIPAARILRALGGTKFQPPYDDAAEFILSADKAGAIVCARDGSVVSKIELPGLPLAVSMLPGFGYVGTEGDGTVWMLSSHLGKPYGRKQWSTPCPQRIVKQIAQGRTQIAVSYWGGTVRMIAMGGSVRTETENVFTQDVTDTAWVGERLVVGTGDGRVVLLKE